LEKGEEVDVWVLEDFNMVELDVVIVLVIVLVLGEVEVELEVHGIAVFPDIEARVESWLGGIIVKFVPALLSHIQVAPTSQPQDHESPCRAWSVPDIHLREEMKSTRPLLLRDAAKEARSSHLKIYVSFVFLRDRNLGYKPGGR
jgi:hypothetical protein